MLHNWLFNDSAAAVSTLGVGWGGVCTFAQPRWHRQSHAEECSAMSRSAAVTRNILEFFSLRFTTFVYQPLAEVTVSSAKKCCFPKSFGRVSQRFVFLLLPNLETVFKGGKKKTTWQINAGRNQFWFNFAFLSWNVSEFTIYNQYNLDGITWGKK